MTASTDSSVRFWDIRQGKATHTIAMKGQNINMTVSPDGKMVVVGDRNDVITFIDTATGKVIEELSGRQLAPKGIEVSNVSTSMCQSLRNADKRIQVQQLGAIPLYSVGGRLNTDIRDSDTGAISQSRSTSSSMLFGRCRSQRKASLAPPPARASF